MSHFKCYVARILICVMTFSMVQSVYADELDFSESAAVSDTDVDDTGGDESSDDSDSSTEPSLSDGEDSGSGEFFWFEE